MDHSKIMRKLSQNLNTKFLDLQMKKNINTAYIDVLDKQWLHD